MNVGMMNERKSEMREDYYCLLFTMSNEKWMSGKRHHQEVAVISSVDRYVHTFQDREFTSSPQQDAEMMDQ